MPRDFNINGATIVRVRFGDHVRPAEGNIPNNATNLSELGLASEGIQVTITNYHTDLLVDDYGQSVPAEVLSQLADARINMKLIHYDPATLDLCLAESLGGVEIDSAGGFVRFAGVMPPAGSPLGGYVPFLESGYHFVSLNITSPDLGFPIRFPAAYLTGPPVVTRLGTQVTIADLNWRAIPYVVPLVGDETTTTAELSTEPDEDAGEEFEDTAPKAGTVDFFGEISSSGAILFDHVLDN